MKNFRRELQKRGNIVARENGCSIAHAIYEGDTDGIIEHIAYGYRKRTTGEYVPNSYRRKFGWKNTYYQEAITKVSLVNLAEQYVNLNSMMCLPHINFK